MKIVAIMDAGDNMFVFIKVEDGYIIRMTPRCLAELGWKVGYTVK